MQLNEIHNPSEHASVSLKTILLVFAIVLIGTLGYLVYQQNTEVDNTDYSVPKTTKTETKTEETVTETTAETKTVNRFAIDKAGKYLITLPDGYTTAEASGVEKFIPTKDERLVSLADSLTFNLNKTVTGVQALLSGLSGITLEKGFSSKEEKLTRVFTFLEFSFKAKKGDLVPAGQDRIELGNAKALTGTNGYFESTPIALSAISPCTAAKTAMWVPVSDTSTVLVSIYECNENEIAKIASNPNYEAQGSRPTGYVATAAELDTILIAAIQTIGETR